MLNRVSLAYLGGVFVGVIVAVVALLADLEDEDREEREERRLETAHKETSKEA